MAEPVMDDANVIRALHQIAEGLSGHGVAMALQAGALLVQNEWKRIAPHRTGTYKRSIHTEVESEGEETAGVFVGSGITDPPYPIYLEYGPGLIEPINAKALHFKTRGGADVFVKRVFVPAHPSAGPAFDATKDAALREINETMKALTGL